MKEPSEGLCKGATGLMARRDSNHTCERCNVKVARVIPRRV